MIVPHDVEKGFIGFQNPAVEIPDKDADDVGVDQASNLRLALPQCFLAALALDELTDLAADGSQHVEQLLIGLPDLAAEKLDHAQDFPPEQDRKAQGRV
jgi:hypothetical protein